MGKKQYKQAEIELVLFDEKSDVLNASGESTFSVFGWWEDGEDFE